MGFLAVLRALYRKMVQFIAGRLKTRQKRRSGTEMEKITLYIGTAPADISEEALLSFTYQFADLERPAAVLNSYSRQLVLPPTERNNRIFGEFWRPDKTGSTPFDALARVPFVIRSESGRQLESGYVKLNSASAREGYDISLFGGLGGFFYGLMQDEDGGKKTLASLDYGTDLAFIINAATVTEAWGALKNRTPGKWQVVNFAPMDNGLPSGDFDATRALVPVGSAKAKAVSGEGGKDGYALVTMPKEQTEWAMRDLRSYMQRPVFCMRALLAALEDRENNGGYTFDWTAVAGTIGARTWMALPLLTDINFDKISETLDVALPSTAVTTGTTLSAEIYTAIPPGAKVAVSLTGALDLATPLGGNRASLAGQNGNYTVIFVQLLGADSGGNIVTGSDIIALFPPRTPSQGSWTPKQVAKAIGFTPQWAGSFRRQEQGTMTLSSGKARTGSFTLSLEGYGLKYLRLQIVGATYANRGGGPSWSGSRTRLRLFPPKSIGQAQLNTFALAEQSYDATYASATKVRSGSRISKADLLGGTEAPGAYLLGLAKVFGWVFTYDAESATVKVMNRDDFFDGSELDIEGRIDRSQPFHVFPNGIEAKWLQFALGDTDAEWAKAYKDKYGQEYAAQRVNTGTPFNRDTTDVFEGTPFVAAVGQLGYSRYYYAVDDGGTILPGPWLDNGLKYTLWGNSTGNPVEHDIEPVSAAAVLVSLPNQELAVNAGPGYDAWYRVQARDADNRAQDVTGALLLLDAFNPLECVNLSDDTGTMLNANAGTPCWLPDLRDPSVVESEDTGTPVAHFIPWTFEYSRGGDVMESVDMGRPQEVDAPALYYREGLSIYDRRWKAFIADRYDAEARICECWVNWEGMQVGQALLRHFYHFDGCRWALNKVEDYDITGGRPCKCTFVRVQDPLAYTQGQKS